MEEIANQFGEELQELLDRYKDQLTNPQIMRVAQHIFYETLSPKKHPERFQGLGYAPGFPIVDELEKAKKKYHKLEEAKKRWRWEGDIANQSQTPQHMMTPQEHLLAAREYALKTDELMQSTGDMLRNPQSIDLDSSMMHLGDCNDSNNKHTERV